MSEQVEKVNKVATEAAEKAVETVNNTAKNVSGVVTETLSNSVSNMSDLASNKTVIYGLLVVVVVAIICSVIIYYFIVEGVFNKKSVIIEKTKVPIKGYQLSEIDIESFPTSGNGNRRSMTFWIYLNDMNNGVGRFKRVFSIGKKTDLGSPVVILDESENKMYISYDSKDREKNLNLSDINELTKNTSSSSTEWPSSPDIDNLRKYGITIDYIPMQRWVHVAVVVNDGVNGGTMTVYIDGEVAKSVTNGDIVDEKYSSSVKDLNKIDLNNMKLDEGGKLIVGGDGSNGSTYGFNGLLSKVHIFNYDLNSNDVYKDYSNGPIDSWLAALGYGVRAPIYKL